MAIDQILSQKHRAVPKLLRLQTGILAEGIRNGRWQRLGEQWRR